MKHILVLSLVCSLLLPKMIYAYDKTQLRAQLRQVIEENEKQLKAEALVEFNKLDTNHDGVITEDEFLNQQFAPGAEEESVRETFYSMDSNHNGKLTKSEMYAFMKKQMDSYLNNL